MTPEARPTPAQAALASHQRRYPPLYPRLDGLDRVQQLYRALLPGLPPTLHALVVDGRVAVGEIGRHIPDARVVSVAEGDFVVEITSGMMDFLYAIGRTLSGLDNENARLPVVQSTEDTARQLKHVLRSWGTYIRWAPLWPWRRRLNRPGVPIAKSAMEWAEMVSTLSEQFILAHEMGHVALNAGVVRPISGRAEEDADRYGLQFFLEATKQHWNQRMAFAGPIIPLRYLAALERLGVRFSDSYSPQSERLRILRDEILGTCPSTQYFHEAATIMVAYQNMLDDIDNRMSPTTPRAAPDWERILVRLIAELQEVAKERVSIPEYIEHVGLVVDGIAPEEVRKATGTLVEYYSRFPDPAHSFLRADLRLAMLAKLILIIKRLPPELKPLFPPSASEC